MNPIQYIVSVAIMLGDADLFITKTFRVPDEATLPFIEHMIEYVANNLKESAEIGNQEEHQVAYNLVNRWRESPYASQYAMYADKAMAVIEHLLVIDPSSYEEAYGELACYQVEELTGNRLVLLEDSRRPYVRLGHVHMSYVKAWINDVQGPTL